MDGAWDGHNSADSQSANTGADNRDTNYVHETTRDASSEIESAKGYAKALGVYLIFYVQICL